MAGTTGLEPATSAVTGYAASISARSTSEQHWRFVSVHAGLRNARATLAHRCQLLHTHANASSSRSFVEKFVGKSESEDVEPGAIVREHLWGSMQTKCPFTNVHKISQGPQRFNPTTTNWVESLSLE